MYFNSWKTNKQTKPQPNKQYISLQICIYIDIKIFIPMEMLTEL